MIQSVKNFSHYSFFILIFSLILICGSCNQSKSGDESMASVSPDFRWEHTTPESQGFSSLKIESLINQLSENGTQKLLIIRNDKIISEWTKPGWDDSPANKMAGGSCDIVSGNLLLLAALDDGYISPDEPVCRYVTSWRKNTLKHQVSIRHLASHTSGLENTEDPTGQMLFRSGIRYQYSKPGLALMSHIIASNLKDANQPGVRQYLKDKILYPIGVEDNEYEIAFSKTYSFDGIEMMPDWADSRFSSSALARIGRLMLNKGNWQDRQIIDSVVVEEVTRHYRVSVPIRDRNMEQKSLLADNRVILTPSLGWYSNYNGVFTYLPRDAFMTGFPKGDLLLVIPSLNIIVVHKGDNLVNDPNDEVFWSSAENNLFNPVMEAFEEPPYPRSDLISSVEFAPKESVIRIARGSDTWPATWGDDDNLYTAFGDGNGFEPYTEYKLSMGIAMVKGVPPNIEGINIRNQTAEIPGDGPFGVKPCGMLMVDKTLYMFVRNAGNSRLAWSSDYGKKWKWADWNFEFAYPTFVNYGKNYEGARDEYVYIYSHDSEHSISPYMNSNYMVLARVHKDNIKDWKEYEYFSGFSKKNQPIWSEDIRKREAVFVNPGKCHRSGISYNNGLKRYIWSQLIATPGAKQLDTRFRGGLGIFESPNPWGPWKTVYYTLNWDIGPGETASFPPKWISDDGKTCYFLFSGDDNFSVRKVSFGTN